MRPSATSIIFRKSGRLTVGRDQLLNLLEIMVEPLALVLSLWAVAVYFEARVDARHIILSVIAFSLTFPGPARLTRSPLRAVRDILMGWMTLAGLLMLFGYASGYLAYFDTSEILTWLWIAPLSQVSAHLLLRAAAPTIRQLQGSVKQHFGEGKLQVRGAKRGAIHSHAGTGTYVTVSILERA